MPVASSTSGPSSSSAVIPHMLSSQAQNLMNSFTKGRYVFNWGGGGWAGASEGRVISKYFSNWGGSKPVLYATRGGSQYFLTRKNYSMPVS